MRKYLTCVGSVVLVGSVAGGILLAVAFYRPDIAVAAFNWLYDTVNRVERVTPTTFRHTPGDTPYERWFDEAQRQMPVFEGMAMDDVASVALGPWPEMGDGVDGLYLKFADYQIVDGRLLEIPPGGATRPHRGFYEIGLYVVAGHGHTLLRQDGAPDGRVDWQDGSLFSIPLNVSHHHVNDGDGPVRLLVVTSFPFILNMSGSSAFALDNPFTFRDRYAGAADYYRNSDQLGANKLATNLVMDVRELPLGHARDRGHADGGNTNFSMTGNTMLSLHASELPGRTRRLAHRHSSDAVVLVLSGTGYSMTWPEADFDRHVRIDWQAGTLFVPPIYWYHQHFNLSGQPARFLAINAPHLVRNLGVRLEDQLEEDLPEIDAEWQRSLTGQAP